MQMNQVRCFLAMARTLDATESAAECGIDQPALDDAIRQLERELGGTLFAREESRIALTDLGRGMQPSLQRTFEAAQAALDRPGVAGTKEATPLALGVATEVWTIELDRTINELERGLPQLALSVKTRPSVDLLDHPGSGAFDLVIAERSAGTRTFPSAWTLFVSRDRPSIGRGQESSGVLPECGFAEREVALIAMRPPPSVAANAFARAARARAWPSGG